MVKETYCNFFDYIVENEIGINCKDRRVRNREYLDIPVKTFYEVCAKVGISDIDDFIDWLYVTKLAVRANKYSRLSYHRVCGDALKCIRLVVEIICV